MEFLSKYSDCLSNWQFSVAPGPQAVAAFGLLSTGAFYIVWKALTFIRVILSLFVLPGKPVCYSPSIGISKGIVTDG